LVRDGMNVGTFAASALLLASCAAKQSPVAAAPADAPPPVTAKPGSVCDVGDAPVCESGRGCAASLRGTETPIVLRQC
jgi:hypothetical protein